jgi:sirohydrochlorin cobaltochelatase
MPSPHISGIILMGHGSREPGTTAEIIALCDQLAVLMPEVRVAHAFLNQDPKLDDAAAALAAAGCTQIRIMPLLVFIGRHMIDDVPAALERLRALHAGVEFALDPYLFRQPGFAGMLASALEKAPEKAPADHSAA